VSGGIESKFAVSCRFALTSVLRPGRTDEAGGIWNGDVAYCLSYILKEKEGQSGLTWRMSSNKNGWDGLVANNNKSK